MKCICRTLILVSLVNPVTQAQERELAELAQKLSSQIAAAGRRIVAVVSFANSQHGPDFSNFLVGRLNVLLSGSGKRFEIVTRSRIHEILQERRLKYADSFDEKTFAEIGKLAGADSVVSGEYTVFGSRVSITAQVLDVSTGRIIGGEIIDLPKTADLASLLTPKASQPPESGQYSTSSLLNGPPSPASTTAETPAAVIRVEDHGFVHTLERCSASSEQVVCRLRIVSSGADRELAIGWISGGIPAPSQIFDQNGLEHRHSRVIIGDKSDRGLRHLFVRDVPVPVDLYFTVKSTVTRISLLKLRGGIQSGDIAIDFRNIRLR